MHRCAVAIAVLFVLCGCESNTADSRLRQFLRMDEATLLTESEIRAAALRLVPIGSDEAQVRTVVAHVGIGADGLSAYYPPGADGIAYIMVRLDPSTFGIVKREYALALHFGREGKLEDIQAKKWLTGP